MTLPARVEVGAAPNFLANLNAAHRFFVAQDPDAADRRLETLKADLREMVKVLAWSPASGRPARFLRARSAQTKLKIDAVQKLAESAGLPELREYVVGGHVVLYAHSDTEAVLLAIKHQRQLVYAAGDL